MDWVERFYSLKTAWLGAPIDLKSDDHPGTLPQERFYLTKLVRA